MNRLSEYWQLTPEDQNNLEIPPQQEIAVEYMPTRYTLQRAIEFADEHENAEFFVCSSSLFIFIVHDRYELGGGYGLQIIALGELYNKHFEEVEEIEQYLDEHTPYVAHSAVWGLLPSFHTSGKSETDYLKNLDKEGQS